MEKAYQWTLCNLLNVDSILLIISIYSIHVYKCTQIGSGIRCNTHYKPSPSKCGDTLPLGLVSLEKVYLWALCLWRKFTSGPCICGESLPLGLVSVENAHLWALYLLRKFTSVSCICGESLPLGVVLVDKDYLWAYVGGEALSLGLMSVDNV
jgi:hypothetical protein